jgi:hypothetical protein
VTGNAEFWGRTGKENREMAIQACVFLVEEVKRCPELEGVIGLQIVNEAAWESGKLGMYEWYDGVLEEIGKFNENLPIYVSDAWDLGGCLEWLGKRKAGNPVVVDTHKYYTFSESDRSQTPEQIISRISRELGELSKIQGDISNKGACEVIVGEYSCVMDVNTWSKVRPEEREGLVKKFGEAQSQKWQQSSGGSYFWTFQDGMGEWSFIQQTNLENIVSPHWLRISKSEVENRYQKAQMRAPTLLSSAATSHRDYWNKACPGQVFEHERYTNGWKLGFSDASSFFTAETIEGELSSKIKQRGGNKIGFRELWVNKRRKQSGQVGPFVWEWEQGIRAGIAAFELEVGM